MLINKKEVKKRSLAFSESERAGKFTRVGTDFINRIEAQLNNLILAEVKRHPSIGKTLK